MKIYLNWTDFKTNVTNKNALRYVDRTDFYSLSYGEFESSIIKDSGADQTDFETNYKTSANKSAPALIGIQEQVPFAKPDFRTKRSKTSSIITVAVNTTEDIDYLLTEERYVSGGAIIYNSAEMGDYITASVYDKDGIIPEAYRTALCESWPVVAQYIVGEWIPKGDCIYTIDTYPLNAKVTAGLYLRVSYTAINSGAERKVGINYFLTKKI